MFLLAAILTGLVTDVTGAPIPNATVDIVQPAGPSTRTDAEGRFHFEAPPAGMVRIRIRAVGFATMVASAADVIRIEVNAQSACCQCEETPPRYQHKPSSSPSLKGYLVAQRLDDNGEAVLTPLSPGHFEFPNLPPGSYTLKITIPTYAHFEIENLEIRPKTKTTIDGAITPAECPSWTAPCPTTRTLLREKKSDIPVLCL